MSEAKQNLIEAIKAVSKMNGTCSDSVWTRNNRATKAALIERLKDEYGEVYDGGYVSGNSSDEDDFYQAKDDYNKGYIPDE